MIFGFIKHSLIHHINETLTFLKMLLSELEDVPLRYHVNRVYTLLKDIVNGAYPTIELFDDKEIKTLLSGEDLKDVESPFWRLSPDMKVETLPSMRLKTTKDVYVRRRQMNIFSFFSTINKMLAILCLEIERIEDETIAVRLY